MKAFLAALLCVAIGLTGCGWGGKKVDMAQNPIDPHVPNEPPTHERTVANMLDMCASAMDSLQRMKEAAAADDAVKKGVRAAESAAEKYEQRLEELAALDYNAMSDEEIASYMEEISDIITAFREARDILNGLG